MAEFAVESDSFATSTTAGMVAVKTGLSLLMIAAPVGWVGLVVAGATIAGAAAAASMRVNEYTKNRSGSWYDRIMAWLRSS